MTFRTGKNSQQKPLTILMSICTVIYFSRATLNYNCNSSDNPALDNGEAVWRIGEQSTLCVYFVPYQVKVAFKVTVDKNAALSLRNGYEVFKGGDTDIAVQLTTSSKRSQQLVNSSAIHSKVRQESLPNRFNCYSTGKGQSR
jgi:hypothetical protein